MTVDLFIKTCAKDYDWLHWLWRSVDRFATGFRRAVIVYDAGDLPPPVPASLPAVLITTELGPGYHGGWGPRKRSVWRVPGYWWQMGVKLAWSDYTDADAVVILDSDLFFVEPVTPARWFPDGKPIWFVRPWEQAGAGIIWKPSADFFLGRPAPVSAMCRNGFVFTREATAGFLAFMMHRFGMHPLQYVLSPHPVPPEEFEMFGNYLAAIEAHGYDLISSAETPHPPWCLEQGWSWGAFDSERRARYEAILSHAKTSMP